MKMLEKVSERVGGIEKEVVTIKSQIQGCNASPEEEKRIPNEISVSVFVFSIPKDYLSAICRKLYL
jgi:hypothetical protein